ncbi:membrane-anchored mycosin MYCP [Nocardia sp. GAS34]|uniref:type VII secretion-associated serine protease mycosin n=1 Tax=unclassified Nocardia TaxID=2637762 RepID=UPI003D19DAF4
MSGARYAGGVRRGGLRIACAATILGAAVFGVPGPATAVSPPTVNPGALGPALDLSGRPGPLEPTKQKTVCATPMLSGSPPADAPIAQRVLDLPTAWKFSKGDGQKVAVIDTGVNPHPRLPPVQPGGDYVVAGGDGLTDCDGHGTIVAGIIAARPSTTDGFAGVAPNAAIMSIRQLSLAYEAANSSSSSAPGAIANAGYGNVLTLAAAVVRATNMGATVINVSEVACTQAGGNTADGTLGAAVQYAYNHNVVVVAAAGNMQSDGPCKTQNSDSGWENVQTIPSPAWFDKYVLSVGSVDPSGAVSDLTLQGPWMGAAAIGRQIVSLDSKPGGTGLVDSVNGTDGVRPIEGTSFATPFVSGLAALVRSRFPNLTAGQVIDRIERTAHAPGRGRDDKVGHGLIDPVAALTEVLPDEPVGTGAQKAHALPTPYFPSPPDPRPREYAIIGSITCLSVLGIGVLLAIPLRRKRSGDSPDSEL